MVKGKALLAKVRESTSLQAWWSIQTQNDFLSQAEYHKQPEGLVRRQV